MVLVGNSRYKCFLTTIQVENHRYKCNFFKKNIIIFIKL